MKALFTLELCCGRLARLGPRAAIITLLTAGPNFAANCGTAGGIALIAAFPSSLYDQSLASLLQQRLDRDGVSYILVEVGSGSPIAAHWPNEAERLPFGSLVKPFTALAYARSHDGHYPEFDCPGRGASWLSTGHGRLDLPHAVAFSCNAYFLKLAAAVPPEAWSATVQEFHLQQRAVFELKDLAGLRATPLGDPIQLVRAYGKLAQDPSRPGARDILEGMALSASAGTGRAVGRAILPDKALVKTGTGPCVHSGGGQGDGYTIALWPADSPRYALLVQLHNAPGAKAAELAGAIASRSARR
jgi:hypothetical protein